MKKYLPFMLGAALALGTVEQAAAQLLGLGAAAVGLLASRQAAKNAVATPPAATPSNAQLMELDLTPYGAPLLLQVPEGTTAKRSEYDNIWINGPDFALTINDSKNDISSAAQSMADHKSMAMMEGGGYKVIVDKPLVFRAHNSNADIDDNFAVIVNDPIAKKNYVITKGPREDNGIEPYGPAKTEIMFQAAQSAHLTPAALAATPAPPKPAPKLAVRNAAGETDLSTYGLPVLLKVPASTRIEALEKGVALTSLDLSMRVLAETSTVAKLQANVAAAKKQFVKMGFVVTTDEPMAFAAKSKTSGEMIWMVALHEAATGKLYTLEQYFGGHKLSPAQDQAAFAIAKAARLKK